MQIPCCLLAATFDLIVAAPAALVLHLVPGCEMGVEYQEIVLAASWTDLAKQEPVPHAE
jgi:hypothetical protein